MMVTGELPFLAKTFLQTRVREWGPAELADWAQAIARAVSLSPVGTFWRDAEFGITPYGESAAAKFLRGCDAKFWRKKGRKVLRVAQERDAMLNKAIGHGAAHSYSSAAADSWGAHQRAATADFLEKGVLYSHSSGKYVALGDVVLSEEQKTAKIYAVASAIQSIASPLPGVGWGMLTLTLPSAFHSNPKHKKSWDGWNGKTPDQGHAALDASWCRFRAQAAKHGIKITFMRCEEPHADGTPHWHLFFHYLKMHERKICELCLTQWPGGLCVRRASSINGKLTFGKKNQWASLADFRSVRKQHTANGAQVHFDIGATGAGAASFANYLLKYIRKYSDGASPDSLKVQQHHQTFAIRALQFGGLPKSCLTVWDLLRAVELKPRSDKDVSFINPKIKSPRICTFAKVCQRTRGGKSCGMATFLKLQGGLSMCPTANNFRVLPLKDALRNRYGEESLKVVGVKLEQRTVADGKTVWVELERHLFRKDNFEILTKQAAEAVAATFSRSENGSGGFGDLTSIASHRSAVGAELGLIELTVTEPKTDKSGLTVEQLAAVQAPADRDIFISAAAAAGKSKVMVERAVWLVKTGISAKDIVLTTFAVEAANSLKSRLPAALSGIAVGTCHSLAASWGGFDELNPCDFDGMLSRSAAKAPAQRQKIMLVDEAQDLTKLQWQWLRSYGKFLFVVGDDRQSLYSSLGAVDGGMRAAFNESLCRPDDLFAPAPLALSLSLNHRSKSEIVTLGNCIMHAQEPSFAAAAGGKVQVVKVAKRAHEINEILGWALLPLADAIKTRAILARTTAEVSEIRAHLAIHAKDFEDATGIQVLTVHSSKGLEFDSVCYSLGHRKQSELESDAAQCHYVAVTRARSELFVTSAGELPEILGAGFERMCGYIP